MKLFWQSLFFSLLAGLALASGPVNAPFVPNFGTGAPTTQATNQLYFDTSATPYNAWVFNRLIGTWHQYGGGGGGSTSCPPVGQVQEFLFNDDNVANSCTGSAAIVTFDHGVSAALQEIQDINFKSGNLTADANVGIFVNAGSDGAGDNGAGATFHAGTTGVGGTLDLFGGVGAPTRGNVVISGGNLVQVQATGTLNLLGAQVQVNSIGFGPFATASTGANLDAGSTPNSALTNSGMTIAGLAVSLGGSITAANLAAALPLFTSTTQGLAPLSGGGTTNFLRADATWAAPPGAAWTGSPAVPPAIGGTTPNTGAFTALSATSPLTVPGGSVATPAIVFSGSGNGALGFFRGAADSVYFTDGGTARFAFNPNGITGMVAGSGQFLNQATSGTVPAFVPIQGNTGVGIGAASANAVDVITSVNLDTERWINGQRYGESGAPLMGTCGTSPSVTGSDNAFTVTVGSGVVTACTVNFKRTWLSTPQCTESDNSTAVTGDISAISTTAVTFGFSATLGGGIIYAICEG